MRHVKSVDHVGAICLSLSNDQKQSFPGSLTGTVNVWEIDNNPVPITGQVLRKIAEYKLECPPSITYMHIAPEHDAVYFVSVDILKYELSTQRLCWSKYSTDGDGIRKICVSPDGSTLYSLLQNGIIVMHETHKGSVEHIIYGDLEDMCLHHNGRVLYGGTKNGNISIWDTKTRERLQFELVTANDFLGIKRVWVVSDRRFGSYLYVAADDDMLLRRMLGGDGLIIDSCEVSVVSFFCVVLILRSHHDMYMLCRHVFCESDLGS